ncbi:Pituitary-specific positive transcription factor 1 [Frankliniella fusca]|uniref:Pituitary-specific positive transcription factor 1 n=1 Tax=Frankliniella fusca TaxID=407009 RepID=A0AAE1LTY1_9NEOP|nr:Pituitary-specific positive transcription factor 1 [Frankliniella fusca]
MVSTRNKHLHCTEFVHVTTGSKHQLTFLLNIVYHPISAIEFRAVVKSDASHFHQQNSHPRLLAASLVSSRIVGAVSLTHPNPQNGVRLTAADDFGTDNKQTTLSRQSSLSYKYKCFALSLPFIWIATSVRISFFCGLRLLSTSSLRH